MAAAPSAPAEEEGQPEPDSQTATTTASDAGTADGGGDDDDDGGDDDDDDDATKKKVDEAVEKKLDEELDKRLGDVAAGKVLEYGVTGGIGVGINTPLGALDNKLTFQQKNTRLTALPYIMVVPAFWFQPAETRIYCASHWARGQRAAQKDADKLSLELAAETRKELLATMKAGMVRSTADADDLRWININDRTYACAEEVMENSDKDGDGKVCTEAALDLQIATEDRGWTTGVGPKGRCAANKLVAFWVGFPINAYEASVTGTGLGADFVAQTVNARPIVSFGYGFTINAWFSMLIGATYSTFDVASTDATGNDITRKANLWSLTIAPSFNIDLMRSIIKLVP